MSQFFTVSDFFFSNFYSRAVLDSITAQIWPAGRLLTTPALTYSNASKISWLLWYQFNFNSRKEIFFEKKVIFCILKDHVTRGNFFLQLATQIWVKKIFQIYNMFINYKLVINTHMLFTYWYVRTINIFIAHVFKNCPSPWVDGRLWYRVKIFSVPKKTVIFIIYFFIIEKTVKIIFIFLLHKVEDWPSWVWQKCIIWTRQRKQTNKILSFAVK